MQLSQLAPDLTFAVAYFFRDVNLSDHIKIASLARGAGQTAFAQAKPLPPLRAWRNFQAHVALESGHDQVSAQHCLPRLVLHLVNQIAAFDCEIRMSRQAHAQKKVAAFSSARARLALTAQPDSLSFMNTARNLNLIIFHLIRASPAKRDCSGRSVQRFFEWDHYVGLDIRAALGRCLAPAKPAKSGMATAAAEKCFQKVAESYSVELQLNAATSAP